MARSIGAVEIIVEADTKRLRAQLIKDGKKAGRAGREEIERELSRIEGRISKIDGEQEARLVKARMEEALRDTTATLDFTEARAQLRVFEEQAEMVKLALDTSIELSEADLQLMRTDFAVFKQTIEAQEIEVGLDLELDRLRIRRDLAALQAQVAANDAEMDIKVNVDRASKAKADALIRNNMRDTGRDAGRLFSGNFLTGDDTKLIIAAVLSMGDAIASGLAGSVGAATSVVSSGVEAVGAAAASATPLLFGFAGGLTAVVVGSAGMGDALSEVNKEFAAAQREGREMNLTTGDLARALNDLSPEARRTATAFAGIRQSLARVQFNVQERLFSNMAEVVTELGDKALPEMDQALGELADSANLFGRELARVANNTDFSGIADALTPALDDAGEAAIAFVETLEPFLITAGPAAEELAEMIERGAEGLRDWVSANPDVLGDFLSDGIDSLELWVELLKSTGDLLGSVFSAGKDSGDNFLISLNNMIERWDSFLESAEGQSSLEDFFARGRQTMEDLRPVLDGLQEAFSILLTDATAARFGELADSIGDALPSLAELIDFIGELQLGSAFADLLAAMEPVFELFQLLPDQVSQTIGVAIAASVAISKLSTAIRALGAVKASGPLLAITAAVTVATIAYDAFETKAQRTEEQTKELTRALENNVDAMIAAGDAADAASVGVDALNDSLFNAEGSGKKIQAAFALINTGAGEARLGIEDTSRVLASIDKRTADPIKGLTELAEGFGLPADAAAALAEIVNKTDDNLGDVDFSSAPIYKDLAELRDSSGLTQEELLALFGAMEELQDQAENTDLGVMQQAFLDTVSTGTAAEQAILAQAQAMQEGGEIAEGVGPLYEEVTRLLYEHKNAVDDDAASTQGAVSSYDAIALAIEEAKIAHEEEAAALKLERDAAFDAYQQQLNLRDATKEAAIAASDSLGFSSDLARELVELGEAADDAAEAASAFQSAVDALIAPAASVEESFSNLQASLDEFDSLLQGGTEAIGLREDAMKGMEDANKAYAEAQAEAAAGDEEAAARARERADELKAEAESQLAQADALTAAAKSLDLNTEAGRANAEQMRSHAEETLNLAGNLLQAGESAGFITEQMDLQREALEKQAVAFGLTEDEASAYVDTLLGTPELLETLVSAPGLTDALLNAGDLSLLYDELGNPVLTEFESLGIDTAMASSEEFKTLIQELGLIHAAPTIDVSGAQISEAEIANVQTGVDTLDLASAAPSVSMPDAKDIIEQNANMQEGLDEIDRTTATPSVQVDGLVSAVAGVERLDRALRNLTSRTIYVTVVQRVIGSALIGGALGGLPGSMSGELITQPTVRRVGERGYREAIVPLDLPLSRVDPSVRELAALLRGEGGTGQGRAVMTKTMNNNFHITSPSADPGAVATKIVNRAAALAVSF